MEVFMTKKIIAVMGATGHVGQVIAEDLLKRGHTIRVIGRNEKKMRTLLGKGAEIYMYSFDDVEGLTEAFQDCYSVFCMIPPDLRVEEDVYQDKVGEAICKALKKTKVSRVVNLSSIGAELEDGTGPIKGLHRQEERLNAIETIKDLTHLRAGYFMENFSSNVQSILYDNEINSPIRGDVPIYMIATRDIGWKAADLLERTDSVNHHIFDFEGPHEVTFHEATAILGQVLDKTDLKYNQISFEEARDYLLSAGCHPKTAELFIEMYEAFDQGKIKPTQELTPEHCGTTTFDEFAHMFAHKLLVPVRI
jgi:uncharacterized protein YbjT (DUF2867 family)